MLWIIGVFGGILLVYQQFREVRGALIEKTGCFHNGTIFAGGSLVPTMEPCLSCQCNGRTLVCSLRICPEMPVPPPRGCVLVQKKNDCCPYLSCSKYHALYNGPNRRIVAYLDHYERESLDRLVSENVLYRRSDDSDFDGSEEICVKNGTVYKSGSAMSSSSLCSYCYCIGGTQKCVKPKCMLAMEGCKPVFVDSTCCPVRYDCSSKSTGLMKSQNHIRRAGNKHYQRLVQRLQRGRGCIVNSHFYLEGQKMSSDENKPCDICFCIRGSRKCAPKKCAPALRNCLPVVPKGQCCPSSYECGISKDSDRAYLSRQFDLFSLLFGSDESDNSTLNTSEPSQKQDNAITSTSEKSIFDAIREGLEFIDNNENGVNNVLDDFHDTQPAPERNDTNLDQLIDDDDKLSFFDILLGDSKTSNLSSSSINSTELSNSVTLSATTKIPEITDSQNSIDDEEKTESSEDISLFDFLVGDDTSTFESNDDNTTTTTTNPDFDYSSYPDNENNFEEYSGYGPTDETSAIGTEDNDAETTVENNVMMDDYSTTTTDVAEYSDNDSKKIHRNQSNSLTGSTEGTDVEQGLENITPTVNITQEPNNTRTTPEVLNLTIEDKVVTTVVSPAMPLTGSVHVENTSSSKPSTVQLEPNTSQSSIKVKDMIVSTEIVSTLPNTTTSSSEKTSEEDEIIEKQPSEDFFSALLNGLSTILKEDENGTNHEEQNLFNVTNVDAIKTKNDDDIKPTETISVVVTSEKYVVDNVTSANPVTDKIDKNMNITENISNIYHKPEKPIIIKTNPSILEADFNLDYNEPTLPPSLPNLKIIPFLPADAVKTDRKQVVYDYYNIKPTSFPLVTGKPDVWTINPATTNPETNGAGYDRYPSITEKYDPTLYPENYVPYENQKKYGYDDYEYSDFDLPDRSKDKYVEEYIQNKYNNPIKKFDTVLSNIPIESNQYHAGVIRTDIPGFDFDHQVNRFSPPTKTEGGFVPKEPLRDENFYYDNFHSTKFIVDLTTAVPKISQNISNLGTSTPDPFKDVIKTESPPDLHSLIEDKEKFLSNGVVSKFYESPNPIDAMSYDKEIISITTDSSYNYTSEYKDANDIYIENGNISKIQNDSVAIPTVDNVSVIGSSDIIILNSATTARSEIHNSFPAYQNIETENLIKVNKSQEVKEENVENVFSFLFNDHPRNGQLKNRTNDKILFPTHPSQIVINETNEKLNFSDSEKTNKSTISADLNILKDVLLSTIDAQESSTIKFISKDTQITSSTMPDTSTTPNPFLSEPFNKLPFLNPSFPVKPQILYPGGLDTDLDLLLPNLKNEAYNSEKYFHPGGYEILPNDSTDSSYAISPTNFDKLTQHQSEGPTQVFTKPDTTNSLRDPAGILKLAGCNIYGRMYRVGRIISELSGPCLECKCTEIGVNCMPLEC